MLWCAEYSDKAVLETADGKSFCINKTNGICSRRYLGVAEGAGRQQLQ